MGRWGHDGQRRRVRRRRESREGQPIVTRRGRRRSSRSSEREGARPGRTEGARTEFPRSRDETVFHKRDLRRAPSALQVVARSWTRPFKPPPPNTFQVRGRSPRKVGLDDTTRRQSRFFDIFRREKRQLLRDASAFPPRSHFQRPSHREPQSRESQSSYRSPPNPARMGSCLCRPRSTRARDPATHAKLVLGVPVSRKSTYEVPPPTPERGRVTRPDESVFLGGLGRRDDDDDDDDKEEEDTGRERWVSPRSEERLRLQRRARWDKISRTRAVHSPGGRGEGCGSSAGSSAPSPARGFPLARLTAVENGADRTPPTIGSSRGSDGTGRSVAGERPRTERPPALSDLKLQTSNFKRASTEPHPAPALPPSIRNSRRVRSNGSSSGAPGDASSTARRRRAASLELEDTAAFPAPPGARADDDEDSRDEYFRVSSEWISKDESPEAVHARRDVHAVRRTREGETGGD